MLIDKGAIYLGWERTRCRRKVPELLGETVGKSWKEKEGNRKVGVNTDKFVGVGEEAEGFQISQTCSAK